MTDSIRPPLLARPLTYLMGVCWPAAGITATDTELPNTVPLGDPVLAQISSKLGAEQRTVLYFR